jgi:hypothetical protein
MTRLSIRTLIAAVIMLAAAACGRSGIFVDDPEGGHIEFEVYVSEASNNVFTSWELCWEGALDIAQGSTPGDDETARTFQNIPGHQGIMRSPVSEELRAGTWRVRARLTGFSATGSSVRIDLTDCTNTNGDRPTVFDGLTTRVLLNEVFTTCEWYPPSAQTPTTPNMPEGIIQPCAPAVSRLAAPRRLG